MATEQEMMDDLAAADAAGDAQLAQHIAGKIKAARQPPNDGILERLADFGAQYLGLDNPTPAKMAHTAAATFPAIGAAVGGALTGAAGLPAGPGALATGAAGAGLGGMSGLALKKFVDQSLGYEKPDLPRDLLDVGTTGLQDAAMSTGAGVAVAGAAKVAPAVSALLKGAARGTEKRVLSNVFGSLSKTKPLSDAVADTAAERGVFKLFGTPGGAAGRMEAARETVGDQYGQIVADLGRQGITGPDAAKMAQQYMARLKTVNASTMNPAVPRIYESAAERLMGMAKPPQLVRVPGQSTPTPGAVQLPPAAPSPPATATISDFEKFAAMEGAPTLPLARSAEANAQAVGGSADAEKLRRLIMGRPAGSGGTANAREARDAADAMYTAERMGAQEGLPAMTLPGEADRLAAATGAQQAPQQLERFALPPPSPRAAPSYEVRPADNRLSLTQTEDLKRSLQGMAKSAYKQFQPNEVGRAHEETASMMRQAVEDAITQQTANASLAVQDTAARFVPVKQELGRLIEGSNAAREGMARESKRSYFSLPDIIAATSGYAHSGSPLQAAASGVVSHLLRTRGPSTAAVALRGASNVAGSFPSIAPQAERAAMSLAPAMADRPRWMDELLRLIQQKSSPATIAQADQQ